MSAAQNATHHLKNQKGSVMVATLALAAAIAVASSSLMSSLSNQMKIQSRNSSIEDTRNLGFAIQMLFSEAKNCSQNLIASGFGSNLTQLKSKLSYNGNIQVFYPSAGPTHGVMIGPQKTYQKLLIQSVGFTKIKQVTAMGGTYLADLTIQSRDFTGHSLKPITVPFYFSTNSSGAITGCFATSYPYASNSKFELQSLTLEDVLCGQSNGSQTVYSSSGQTCVPKPSVVGSL